MSKKRLDELVYLKGLSESITESQKLIMAGLVVVDNHRVDKSGTMVDENSEIRLKNKIPYVSRGGLKLEKAVKSFHIDFENKILIDIGASTGGFTDVALKFGAKKVYAIDVGKGLLHNNLVRNDRVISIEKTNFREIEYDKIGEKADIIVSDVSFISLKLIIPSCLKFCKKNTKLFLLIKPQFEAEKNQVEKGGIVRNLKIHEEVIFQIIEFSHKYNLKLSGIIQSPIKGAKGNIEYLVYLSYSEELDNFNKDIKKIIHKVVYENYCYHC
jgi:23S rRNA (cytidine1920-2'-O)/16S rRNA (cytidine1409-2'-O)-methyltransferase